MSPVSENIRQSVRERAHHRCEYCRFPEGESRFSHQVDHIRPIKHKGTHDLNNLAWACFQCNNRKGSDIAGYDPLSDTITPLFNPRDQTWDDHFSLVGYEIIGKTPIGRTTLEVLEMNSSERLEHRAWLITLGLWES